ncbi:MAG: hypothetical protein ACD_73C00023G0001 [uncultured bacterium]|nr:MAG: hypothetical protein ACD_73C00023G0001 [uncultured bacterium]
MAQTANILISKSVLDLGIFSMLPLPDDIVAVVAFG